MACTCFRFWVVKVQGLGFRIIHLPADPRMKIA